MQSYIPQSFFLTIDTARVVALLRSAHTPHISTNLNMAHGGWAGRRQGVGQFASKVVVSR